MSALNALVDSQAKDEGLWFAAPDAPTAYIQQALRRLHHAIEHQCPGDRNRRLLEAGERLFDAAQNYASSDPDMPTHQDDLDEFEAALAAYQEAAKP